MPSECAGEDALPSPDWYRRAFGETYRHVYPHRDPEEAAGIVSWLDPVLPLRGARVLDLACGAARFAPPVLDAGARGYVGADLSAPLLLDAARALAGREEAALLRSDMRRIPLKDGVVDVVLSMFTSFGYFDDAGNRCVLSEIARVLARDGCLVVDVMNPSWVASTLVPESVRRHGALTVRERRTIAGHHVRKHVEVSDGPREVDRYVESVRLLSVEELTAWGAAAGLTRTHTWGDYGGGAFDDAASPRIIVRLAKEST